ncbi:G8 domain-containing protein [Seonamhaeicola sp.]|uniref:G8 domain-containing protein n=1 Tax=Seonamhaeicola sp. TaxID=1912245 RepID=UPI0026061A99|nr:G8 domain-containing protein [Seonamhaeicola sp.]
MKKNYLREKFLLKSKISKLWIALIMVMQVITLLAQTPVQVAGTANKTAVQSGNWSSAATWGGSVPSDLDRVLIPNGITVTVDGMISQEMKSVRIANGGKLQYATNVNTELRTEFLVSEMGGAFEIGTETNKINPNVTASLVFAEKGGTSKAQDKNNFVPGAVFMGPVRMHGADKTSWDALSVQPAAGANQLVLKSAPSGWRVGDKLVVAGTDPNSYTSDEMVTISSISGNTVTLSENLARSHQAPSQIASLVDVHVSNNTRNIIISSEDKRTIAIGQSGYHKPRGHMMFMHNADVILKYVQTDGLGRTDKKIPLDDWDATGLPRAPQPLPEVPGGFKNPRGRYSIHFHRSIQFKTTEPDYTINPPQAKVEGCVVNNDPGWGYVNHSSNVEFKNNVSYDVVGSAYCTEAGNEIGSFIGNIAIRTYNSNTPMEPGRPSVSSGEGRTDAIADSRENLSDFAWQGDGFWFHSTGVTVENNVVSGSTGHAYVYWSEGLVEHQLGITKGDIDIHVPAAEFETLNTELKAWKTTHPYWNYDIWYIKCRPFKNNQAYSMARGVHGYYMMTTFHEATDFSDAEAQSEFNLVPPGYRAANKMVMENTTLWSMKRVGFGFTHCAQIDLVNNKVYGYGTDTGVAPWQPPLNDPYTQYIEVEPAVLGMDLDHDHNTRNWNLINNTVVGFDGSAVAVALPVNDGNVVVNGGVFDNSGVDLKIRETNWAKTWPDRVVSYEDDSMDGLPIGAWKTTPWRTITIQGNIQFNNSNKNIVLAPQYHMTNPGQDGFAILNGGVKMPGWFLIPDNITLNFGPFSNARVYFDDQRADFIPVPNSTLGRPIGIPVGDLFPENFVNPKYIGKTNQQLQTQYGSSFGGVIMPAGTVTHAMITGGKVDGNGLSVSENALQKIRLYPNPVKDEFVINLPSLNHSRVKLEIFSLTGKLLKRTSIDAGNTELTVPVSGLSNGIYLVKLHMDRASKIFKIVKD